MPLSPTIKLKNFTVLTLNLNFPALRNKSFFQSIYLKNNLVMSFLCSCIDKDIVHINHYTCIHVKNKTFIMVCKVLSELVRPKYITKGSNAPS